MDKIIMFIVGFAISFFVTYFVTIIKRPKPDGTMHIVKNTNSESYQWILNFNRVLSIDEIKNKKEIRLKICYKKDQEDV